jgi:hypothetical protein
MSYQDIHDVAAKERRRIAGSTFVTVVAIVLAVVMSGCTGLTGGYRTLEVIRQAGNQAGKTMAAVCKDQRLGCVEKHKTDKPALVACLKPCTDALTTWVKYVRPSVNSAQLATWGALETAYAARKHKTDWLVLLKPGACALLKILKQWDKMFPAAFKSVIATVSGLEGLVCS